MESPPSSKSVQNGGVGGVGGSSKQIPEVFLTRLLSTKGTLKKFIDDFFLRATSVESKFPCAVKWLYDFFDDCGPSAFGGHGHGDLVHNWKANAVTVRFWANLLRNPDILFDVERTRAVDNNLAVVAETLVSVCGYDSSDPDAAVVGKDSPPHRLLFAKEISEHGCRLRSFFRDVQQLPSVTDDDFSAYMRQLSQRSSSLFNRQAALRELLIYVTQFYEPVLAELRANNFMDTDLEIGLHNLVSTAAAVNLT